MKKYLVELSQHERESLRNLVRSGKGPARMFSHARILLKADASEGAPAWPDERISDAFDVTVQTVERVRKHPGRALTRSDEIPQRLAFVLG